MQRTHEIEAAGGAAFTVEPEAYGYRSVFPPDLADKSRLHPTVEEAWAWVHQVRALQAAVDDRREREFTITLDVAVRRTFRVQATGFEEATGIWREGKAELVQEETYDPSDLQVTDRDAGQWVFFKPEE